MAVCWAGERWEGDGDRGPMPGFRGIRKSPLRYGQQKVAQNWHTFKVQRDFCSGGCPVWTKSGIVFERSQKSLFQIRVCLGCSLEPKTLGLRTKLLKSAYISQRIIESGSAQQIIACRRHSILPLQGSQRFQFAGGCFERTSFQTTSARKPRLLPADVIFSIEGAQRRCSQTQISHSRVWSFAI